MEKLTQERLKELFYYDDGDLIRKVASSNSTKVGDIVAANQRTIYKGAWVDYRRYPIHRLVWLYHHGYLPESDLDHIDRDTWNNRIENLREVSEQCNMRNQKQQKSVSGVKGVVWNASARRPGARVIGSWCAQITINWKCINLGRSDDFIEAVALRLAAEQCVKWDGCDSTSPAFLAMRKYLEGSIEFTYDSERGTFIMK